MNELKMILLGVVQGLTEFLPVSSSGHLVLAQRLLGFEQHSLTADLVAHLGTLLAVVWFYRRELVVVLVGSGRLVLHRSMDDGAKLGLFVLIATVPTGLMGVLLKDFFLGLFGETFFVGCFFLVTAALLALGHLFNRWNTGQQSFRPITIWRAFLIGLAQGFAIAPGVSRSGTTISVGYMLGLNSEVAARFSFLISIPAILGAIAVGTDWSQLASESAGGMGSLGFGLLFLAAFATGLSALSLLIWIMRVGKLYIFSIYLIILGSWTIYGLGRQ